MKTRMEHDLIGDKEIPNEVYYGVQTARAQENFHITGVLLSQFPTFIESLAKVKKATALANYNLGTLEENKKNAICSACDEIIAGSLHDQFVVDMIQGGAGTSINMNANEVIANRALEILGHEKGEYQYLHPNNDVNKSQSTNDSYPTAFRIALFEKIYELIDSMNILRKAFSNKADEFKDVVKMGRTQLQDAVPMTLGQEFHSFATMIEEDIQRLVDAQQLVREMNLGATAIGTGINSHPAYAHEVELRLQEVTGRPFVTAKDLVEATQDTGAYVQISGVLKRVATKISKICNDLRLLSSGPRTGFNEINLPAMQPGSSIMPGKVNPVIPEVVNQVAFQVIGTDVTITMASEGGQLQLNVFEPVIAYNLFNSINMMKNAFETLAEKCVVGITANEERCKDLVLHSIGLVTALNPYIGYENSTNVAKEALDSGRSVYDIVLEKKLLTKEELDDIIKPENMIKPRERK
ncbi:aspartate ammonia-lyase [Malaciobacter molluscorum LMG 25693]|uniref:Aspartate ammonia-lyase n=1 Tax=Malaciobacter molluscorum LMG 25693 TaxID=870501 RepID=A0A2G1DG91_9BACT|nr:aspartate ammonia-lyase [Malaciobacter molluscorum]AXX93468.1 aspartate ammonia-lyase [Malaciobacter molluscorum LMG 25693]PHO17518.1 aspartate ammonia-lyase [Malaciobacter molluscorum LMG 25693]RXJ93308.1 aspartate ammonia-lyase [Malaciobacter molluscorum]